MKSLEEFTSVIRAFAQARDWEQFHSPKNLAIALAVEAAELMEHFQWLTEQQSRELGEEETQAVAEEIADIQIYLLRIADQLGVDVTSAVARKLEINERKYPVDKARGNALKYSRLGEPEQ